MQAILGFVNRPSVPFEKYEKELYFGKDKDGLKYLKEVRGLKNKTLQHFHVGYNDKQREIAIPVFKSGDLVDYKFRKIDAKEFRRHSGGETWVVNEQAFQYAKEDKYIICVEGEFDAMALYQLGFHSVVSTTGGAQGPTTWIDKIPKGTRTYVCYDNDEPGQEAAQKLAERIGLEKCYNVVFKDVKDANEFLLKDGTKEKFQKILDNAEKFKIQGILNLREVIDSLEKNKIQRIPTFLSRLTSHLGGGVPKAGIITISGNAKTGKSSLLMNLCINHAMTGLPVLLISLENDLYFTVQRLLEIIVNKPYRLFTPEDFADLRETLSDFPLYLDVSLGNWDIKRIEKVVEQMKKLYGIEIFGFDHLSYLSGDEVKDIDDVMRRIKMLSRNQNIVSYIVSHIRRLKENDDYPTSNDLRGSSSIAQESNAILFMQGSKNGSEINIDLSRMSRSKLRIPIMFEGSTGVITDDMGRSVLHYDEVVPDEIFERKEIKIDKL